MSRGSFVCCSAAALQQLYKLETQAQTNFLASAFDPNKWKALLK
jgi:hypothetical protein